MFLGEPGIHSHIRLDDGQVITTDEKLKVTKVTSSSVVFSHEDGKCQFKVVKPDREFASVHQSLGGIGPIDVSPGGLGISASESGGELNVWETSRGVVRRTLEGHLGDIYCCKLFPSGIVVLSSGSDMRIKIWSAEDGSNPVTLCGHRAPVTCLAIVEKGMNVVSGSKDGTVRLWSCGKNKCLEPVIEVEDIVISCDITSVPDQEFLRGISFPDFEPPRSIADISGIDRTDEVLTENKLLAVGGENGWLSLINLYQRKIVFRVNLGKAVNVAKFHHGNNLLVGTDDGMIRNYDICQMSKCLEIIHDSNSPVISLLSVADGFFAGRTDGSCVYYPNGDSKKVLLSGADIDPVHAIVSDGDYVYTSARDGVIRKYYVNIISKF